MIHVICRLTAKNRDQLRNPTLGNRVWATFTFFTAHSEGKHPPPAFSFPAYSVAWTSAVVDRRRDCSATRRALLQASPNKQSAMPTARTPVGHTAAAAAAAAFLDAYQSVRAAYISRQPTGALPSSSPARGFFFSSSSSSSTKLPRPPPTRFAGRVGRG